MICRHRSRIVINGDAPLFPFFVLQLAGRRVVLVGGGTIAAARLKPLLQARPDVAVIPPGIGSKIESAGVTLLQRALGPRNLDAAWFVAAVASHDVNRAVARVAEPPSHE